MFNPLKGIGDVQKLMQIQNALKKEEIVVDKDGVRVVVRGDQQIKEIEVDGIVEKRIADAVNEAVKKTQEQAARKLIEMSK